MSKSLKKTSRLVKSAKIRQIKMPKRVPASEDRFPCFEEEFSKSENYQEFERNKHVEESLIKTINKNIATSKITPRSDYYTYINSLWLNKMKSGDTAKSDKKFYSQLDDFRVVQEKVYNDVLELVEEYTSKNPGRRDAVELKNVFKSFANMNGAHAKQHIDAFSGAYAKFSEANNLWGFLALINMNEVISWGSPIVWAVLPDEKNAQFLRSNIAGPSVTLFDMNMYSNDEGQTREYIKYKRTILKQYFAYMDEMFVATLGVNHGLSAKDVFDVECQILDAYDSMKIKEDVELSYKIVSKADSLSKYEFDWGQFCHEIGMRETPESFVTGNLNYLLAICQSLKKEWNGKKWKSYWFYIFLRQFIRFHDTWRNIHYNFIEHTLNGVQAIMPKKVVSIIGMSLTFNTLLSHLYILKYKNDDNIHYATNLAKDLLTVFKRRIHRNNWLQPETKKNALLKLDNFKMIIGYPEAMREDPLLGYVEDDAWANILKITDWRVKQFTTLENQRAFDIPYIDWQHLKLVGKQPYIVNAFYTPTENSIYIPLAYLQKPFIDLQDRGIEYNLARIGHTLGHEMSHSLDDFGSLYDYKGNLNTWTNPKDLAKLRKIKDDITKQYEEFAARDGIIFDASIALGENMADISGLAICEEYLMDFQLKNEDIIPIKTLSFKAFFVYVAMNQRQHIYKAAIKSQLKINPHPLDKYRTNIPLSRLALFRNIYGIKKGDLMYWPSISTIW